MERVTEKVGEKENQILKLIIENKFITYKELAQKTNISEKSIYKNVDKLKQKNLIKRIGPDKGGWWEVVKD